MSLEVLLREARLRLREAGIPTADLDARLLVGHQLGLSAAALILHADRPVEETDLRAVRGLLAQREAGWPVARLVGARAYGAHSFALNDDTLEPRPDTECVGDHAIGLFANDGPGAILDLGTGSGNLIVSLLDRFGESVGTATDISENALRMARANARAAGVADRCSFVTGNWAASLAGRFDLIVSNPPYIETGAIADLGPEVRLHDPHRALDGGRDGLEAYCAIAGDIRRILDPAGFLVVEIGLGQAKAVTDLFAAAGLKRHGTVHDLAGHQRGLSFARGP